MFKLLELITEVIGFVAIVVSPLLIGLGLGCFSHNYIKNDFGIVIGIGLTLFGLILGIVLAKRKWKGDGTVNFLSRISATPELDWPPNICVKARIKLLSKEEGGISIPLKSKARPNHFFGGIEQFHKNYKCLLTNFGEMTFEDEFFYASEIKIVSVQFMWAENIKDIKVGTKWIVCFGNRMIGEGEVLEM